MVARFQVEEGRMSALNSSISLLYQVQTYTAIGGIYSRKAFFDSFPTKGKQKEHNRLPFLHFCVYFCFAKYVSQALKTLSRFLGPVWMLPNLILP